MMLVLLLLCHFFTGYGLLNLMRVRCPRGIMLCLSVLMGIAVASFLPFLLQLCYCPLWPGTVLGALALVAVVVNVKGIRELWRAGRLWPVRRMWRLPRLPIRIYELPAILALSFVLFVSVWRCYYQPPLSRDVLSGPEAIAEFAVREHTMSNSLFSVDLSTTNNPFKSPFLVSLQVIYKMAGYPFGQVWLSMIVVSFTLLLYLALRKTLHPILAGLLLLLMTIAPELYSYSFLILYDYSNMVFFFLSLYVLFGGGLSSARELYLSALLMGVATYIRSETLVLALFFLPWILRGSRMRMLWFLLPSVASYFLTTYIYINHYLPVGYNIGALVNPHPFHLWPLFGIYRDIIVQLMASRWGIDLWGYYIILWAVLLLAELLVLRRFSSGACRWLYAAGVVFFGLGLLSFLLPLVELDYTVKRGLFKILPVMLLYMANNQLLIRWSGKISRWEQR